MMSEIDCNKCRWQNNCQNDCFGFEPIVEQTNEEWFCGLSTEEKAEFLSNSGMFESCNEAMFWLKEKHDDN